MAISWLSVVSVGAVTASLLIAAARYVEFRREVQRDIYMAIVGTEYEFEFNDETHTLEVVNVTIGGGRFPWNWGTVIAVEFDIEAFPWPGRANNNEPSDMEEDLLHDIEWMKKDTPEIVDIRFLHTSRKPGLMVTVPTTDIFILKEVLQRLPHSIETVFKHYNRDVGEVENTLRETRQEILEASAAQARAYKRGLERLKNYR